MKYLQIKEGQSEEHKILTTPGVLFMPKVGGISEDYTIITHDFNMQTKTVTPTTSNQTVTPDVGVDGFTSVIVSGVTSSIDANIQPNNI